MQRRMRAAVLLATGVALGFGLTLGAGVLAQRENPTAVPETLPIEELRTFTDVYARIKADYVEPVDDKTLFDHAIRGMLAGLDPHSTYLDPDEFKELQASTSGTFGGLGIEVSMEDGFVKVVAPIDDTPAQRAGIQAGDLIIRLDDKPVQGMSLNDAVKIMRGEPGTKIKLTVVRKGLEKPLELTLERDIIRVKSVKSRMLEPGFGYVRITQFQSQTGEQLVQAVEELMKQADGKLHGVVLDLRNNPGGVLQASVSVADAFLEDGLVVYTDGRVKDARMRYSAHPGDVLQGAPMVVLVNGGSASASEIVAGALQDHKRAIIIGSKTFGKGSVQSIQELANGGAVKLTTSRYYTPSGRSIQAEGIVPDIALPLITVEKVETEDPHFKEADLSRHLDNPNGTPAEDADKAQVQGEGELAQSDFALFEALNVLKGLVILRAN